MPELVLASSLLFLGMYLQTKQHVNDLKVKWQPKIQCDHLKKESHRQQNEKAFVKIYLCFVKALRESGMEATCFVAFLRMPGILLSTFCKKNDFNLATL